MSNGPSEPIRVCLLVEQGTVREWEDAAIERMVAETSAEIDVVVNDPRPDDRSTLDLVVRGLELREWAAVALLRSVFAAPFPLCDEVRLAEQPSVADAEWIDCEPETVDGWKTVLPADVVRQIRADADVAVRFGFGVLGGDVLTAPDYGVLSYHHGDLREYRGQPAGCWEYIHGRSAVGITLQRLTEQLDAGEVVVSKTVPIDDTATYTDVRGVLYEHSVDVLATAIARLEAGQTEFETVDDLGHLYTFPRGRSALRFLRKEIRGHVRRWLGQSINP